LDIDAVAGGAGDRFRSQRQGPVIGKPQQTRERRVIALQEETIILGGQIDRPGTTDTHLARPVSASDCDRARGYQMA